MTTPEGAGLWCCVRRVSATRGLSELTASSSTCGSRAMRAAMISAGLHRSNRCECGRRGGRCQVRTAPYLAQHQALLLERVQSVAHGRPAETGEPGKFAFGG